MYIYIFIVGKYSIRRTKTALSNRTQLYLGFSVVQWQRMYTKCYILVCNLSVHSPGPRPVEGFRYVKCEGSHE